MSEANPWVVQPPKQTGQVPNGFYTGEFQGVEEFALPQDGSLKWRFAWQVDNGPEKGKMATALTDRSISPTTLPGRLIAGLLGRPLVAGENVQEAVAACVGEHFLVSVEAGPKGGKPGVRSCGKPPQM